MKDKGFMVSVSDARKYKKLSKIDKNWYYFGEKE